MTAPEEPIDGDLPIDPTIARVLLFYHEAVAQASERAYLDLYDLGVDKADITAALMGRRSPRLGPRQAHRP